MGNGVTEPLRHRNVTFDAHGEIACDDTMHAFKETPVYLAAPVSLERAVVVVRSAEVPVVHLPSGSAAGFMLDSFADGESEHDVQSRSGFWSVPFVFGPGHGPCDGSTRRVPGITVGSGVSHVAESAAIVDEVLEPCPKLIRVCEDLHIEREISVVFEGDFATGDVARSEAELGRVDDAQKSVDVFFSAGLFVGGTPF